MLIFMNPRLLAPGISEVYCPDASVFPIIRVANQSNLTHNHATHHLDWRLQAVGVRYTRKGVKGGNLNEPRFGTMLLRAWVWAILENEAGLRSRSRNVIESSAIRGYN